MKTQTMHLQNMIRYLLFTAMICVSACKNVQKDPESLKVVTLLTPAEVEQLGFKTKAVRVGKQSEWEKNEFGSTSIMEQDIKSLTEMKGSRNMYPRFTIIRETYETAKAASIRAKRLRDHDPKMNNKMFAKLVLRDGFAVGKEVWIVATDAMIFSRRELDKVKKGLFKLKN